MKKEVTTTKEGNVIRVDFTQTTQQVDQPQQPKEGKLLEFPNKHKTRRLWFFPGI